MVQMIQRCLKNRMRERPTIQQVMGLLEEARAEVEDGEYDMNKLSLAQLLQSRNLSIQQQGIQIDQQQQQIRQNGQEICSLREQNEATKEQNDVQNAQITSLEEQVQALRAENTLMKKLHKTTPTPKQVMSGASPFFSVQSLQWPLSLNWRKGKDIPTDMLRWASTVVINGMVYCGGNDLDSNVVIQYNPESGDWSELPRSPVKGFAMTSLNGQLVLAGGLSCDTTITVWDSGRSKWVHPYPPMPTGRVLSAAVGYQNYLIVACGVYHMSEVDMFDSSSGRLYSAQPVPVGGHTMSSVVVGDRWYLSSFGFWEDGKEHIFWAHLPTVTSSATSAQTTTERIWHELPTPPVEQPTLLALQGHLLLVGGLGYVHEIHHYDQETRQWRVCGQLPVGMYAQCCTELPSGDLMVAGGLTWAVSERMWIAKI